jgi:hypothetical protein
MRAAQFIARSFGNYIVHSLVSKIERIERVWGIRREPDTPNAKYLGVRHENMSNAWNFADLLHLFHFPPKCFKSRKSVRR